MSEDNVRDAVAALIDRPVIVRARDASPFFGVLQSVDGRTVALADARRIRSWYTAGDETTLSGVARHGVVHDHASTHICGPVKTAMVLDVCEILSMSAEAVASLQSCPVADQA